MSAKIDISPVEMAIVHGVLKDHLPKGTLAWVFGGRVTWTAKPFSDLNIALEGEAPLPPEVLIDLEEAFAQSDLPWRVDVIDMTAVSPEFRAIVERQRVPADWRHMTFAEAGITLFDCDHKTPSAQEFGRPYVGIPQMTTGRVDFATARKISEADFVTWTRKTKYRKDDVILSRRTNPGVTAVDDTGTEFALGQNLVLLRADGTKVFPPFLRWIVQSPAWWVEIEKYLNVGAVFSSLRCADVPKFEFSFPPTWEQVNIAKVLSALDDKIELNRRMNETLEVMARAVFRDWFVDFGPTRRKAAGETDPAAILGGLVPDPTQAALFPDSFGANGLPEAWEVKTLGDVVEPRKGRNITKKTVVPGDVPVVAGGLNPAYYHNTPNVTGPVITASASGANAGFVRLYHQDIWASDCSFISRKQTDYLFTIYALLSSRQDEIYTMQQGAAQPHIYPSDLMRLPIADGPGPVWQSLEKLLAPMFELIANNEQESQTLAATRDLLLPKLMSGEIRLKDA